jgi:hypothetical protein
MKVRKKTKMCWHCNGINPFSAVDCAYCGATLEQSGTHSEVSTSFDPPYELKTKESQDEPQLQMDFDQTRVPQSFPEPTFVSVVQDKNDPLYSVYDQPPLEQKGKVFDELTEEETLSKVPSLEGSSEENVPGVSVFKLVFQRFTQYFQKAKDNTMALVSVMRSLVPICLFWMGSLCAVFAIMLFLFGHEGHLVLSWSTQKWPLLMVAAFPMLYFGWKQLPEDSKQNT